MREEIVENITRLSLHDSIIEKIDKTKDKLILVLDWAKLENYTEKNIGEGIILGKCELIFYGYIEENLKLDFSGIPDKKVFKPKVIQFDIDLFHNWLILQNKLILANKYLIGGLIEYENNSAWLDWSFSFLSFKLTWSNYITWVEWQNGKLINEE